MADPIIRIIIRDEGGQPVAPGAPGGGGTPPLGGTGGSHPHGGGGRGDESSSVGQLLRTLAGGNTWVGRALFKALGLDQMFDDLGKRLDPAVKAIREKIGGLFENLAGGKGGKTQAPTKSPSQDLLQGFRSGGGNTEFPGAGKGLSFSGDIAAAGEGGGALSSLAGLAGPVGIAIMAFDLMGKAVGAVADKTADAIRGIGHVGADIARNNPGPALRALAGGIVDAADSIPLLGKAITPVPKIFLALVDAGLELRDAFLGRAAELAKYSGDIGAAQQQRQVNQIYADVREANALGPAMAQLIREQSRLETSLQSALEPLKEALLEKLAIPIVHGLGNIAAKIDRAGIDNLISGAVAGGIEASLNIPLQILGTMSGGISTISVNTATIKELLFGKDAKKEAEKDLNAMMRAFQNIETPQDTDVRNSPEIAPWAPGDGFAAPLG